QARRLRRGLHPAQLHHLRAVRSQRLFAASAPGGVLSPPALQTRDSGARRGQYVPLRGPVVGLLLPCRRHWAAMVPSLSTSPPPGVVGAVSLAALGVAQALLHLERALDPGAAHRPSAQEILPRAAADLRRFPGPPAFGLSLRRTVRPARGALFRRARTGRCLIGDQASSAGPRIPRLQPLHWPPAGTVRARRAAG